VDGTTIQENDSSNKPNDDLKRDDVSKVAGLISESYINVAPENRMQVLSYFLERYLPASMTSQRTFITPSSWVRSLPSLLGRWEVLDTALSALCLAYIGDVHQDYVHSHESQRFYNDVLQRVRSMSLDSLKSSNEGVLTTTMTMAMYEV
jgi:hypothetical protein